MTAFGIAALGVHTPVQRETTKELVSRRGYEPDQATFLEKILGLRQVAHAQQDETLDVFLQKAIDDCMAKIPEGIRLDPDLILYTHSTLPQVPHDFGLFSRLRKKYGWRRVPEFGVSHLNCSSIISTFEWLKKLETRNEVNQVLVITGDLTHFMPEARHIKNSTIVGDSASAALFVRDHPRMRLVATSMLADTRYCLGFYESEKALSEFGKSYQELLTQGCQAALDVAKISWDDIRLILPHNVNLRTWKQFCKITGVPEAKVVWDLLPDLGHSYCNDGQLNLDLAMQQGRLAPGDPLLWVSVGLGFFFGAAVFRC